MTYRPGPRDLRASDFERDRVVSLLGEAAADGRLTPREHVDRVERAYQARTLGELAALTTDLVGPAAQPIRLQTTNPKHIAGNAGPQGTHFKIEKRASTYELNPTGNNVAIEEEIAKAGATAFIQPGGSVRDNDVIAAADRLGLAMVFTGMRHFLH